MTTPRQRRAAGWLDRTGVGGAVRRLPLWNGVLVLNYHRVVPSARDLVDPGVWAATPEGLDAHLRFLVSDADLIAPEDFDSALTARRGRRVLITFDDGYRDNYTHAFPVLRAHGARAAFFLATGYLDHPRLAWWDEVAWMLARAAVERLPAGPWGAPIDLHRLAPSEPPLATILAAYKAGAGASGEAFLDALASATGAGRAPDAAGAGLWMSWDEARALRDAGMTVGGHTVNHPVLATLPEDRQREEISGCAERLEAELGAPMRWFSYPVGGRESFDRVTQGLLRDIGVMRAFSYYGGVARGPRLDPYDVPRVSVVPDTDPAVLAAMLALPGIFGRW